MGSRSKEAVGRRATSIGRQFKKPKKPLVVRFTDALEDLINTNAQPRTAAGNRNRRRRGQRALDLPTLAKPHVERPAPTVSDAPKLTRKTLRAVARGMARTMLTPFDEAAPVPRAERRRAALVKARAQMVPKKQVRA